MARKRVKASAWLGITAAPYTGIYLSVGEGDSPPPLGSPDHKRTADAIIAGVRAESQRAAIHMDSVKRDAEYAADCESLVEEMMRSVDALIRDRFGESYAGRLGSLTYADAMAEADGAIDELPAAFRDAIREWRLNRPKARLAAPEIEG